jgi:hypothetical protein
LNQLQNIFAKGPVDVLDYATRELVHGSELAIHAMKHLSDEGLNQP